MRLQPILIDSVEADMLIGAYQLEYEDVVLCTFTLDLYNPASIVTFIFQQQNEDGRWESGFSVDAEHLSSNMKHEYDLRISESEQITTLLDTKDIVSFYGN